MTKKTLLHVSGILVLALLTGIFFNISNPNRIQFIANEKIVDFSASDSLLNALRIQDSILKAADSLKNSSNKRDDSLRLAMEKHVQDSILAANKSDSLKRVQDSLKAVNQKKEDSIKNAQNQNQEFAKPVDIKIDFAKALFDKKYRFIDARDISDYNAGHVQGALNIPFHEIEKYKERLNDLPKDQVYVTYCSTACDVSIDMAYYMAKLGFKKVYIFHGGWDEWKSAGYPAN
ncbi:MAG TPA: rhodanese-like domain-containing protein [Ignavibacteria bacterium]|nr:rhodanese-like domain-containing protein [Ignavibacteria bacterium]HMQ98196.1 rhodanese-like domain-containing protein [Ignavibacteria bacterium]